MVRAGPLIFGRGGWNSERTLNFSGSRQIQLRYVTQLFTDCLPGALRMLRLPARNKRSPRAGAVPNARSYCKRETARAMTRANRMKPAADSKPMSAFARAERGMVSVGLKAMELDKEK
jgi:hypothetical protein